MSSVVLHVLVVGTGAALVMDAWGLILRRAYGVAGPDYRLVGRWVGHLLDGQFRHDSIGRAAPVAAEAALGWAVHFGTGISFAAGLVAIWGEDWLQAPTIAPALITGAATVLAPYLVMQPAFGLGIASSRAPDPTAARLRSLITHLVFGVGLFFVAWLITAF